MAVHTPPDYGHSIDSSTFHFAAEQFAHCTDMVEPGNLPFLNFNSAMSVKSFAGAVQSLLELDWRHLNGGHGDVGNRADAEFYLEYTEDITAAALQAMQAVDFTKFINPEDHPIGALVNWSQAVSDQVLATMQAKYGARKDLKAPHVGPCAGPDSGRRIAWRRCVLVFLNAAEGCRMSQVPHPSTVL